MPRRKTQVIGLSFLDCICCGFGAVILMFVLMNARAAQVRDEQTVDLRSEVDRIEVEVLRMERERVLARNALEGIEEELVETQGLSRELVQVKEEVEEELARQQLATLAVSEHVNELKADLLSLEEGLKRLEAGMGEIEEPGEDMRHFHGDGTRQYLTGLQLRGERTLILIDVSASMLAEKVVDVLRVRNLPREEQRQARKWKQVIRTVEWLMAKMPPEGTFHAALFHDRVRALRDEPGWWSGNDPAPRDEVVDALREIVPASGSSLHLAFEHAANMNPPPDNIILITDSLPTFERSPPLLRRTVTGRRRGELFQDAARLLPPGVPVNTLLFPLEGDPMAAILFWRLTVDTNGSFITVAEDWP